MSLLAVSIAGIAPWVAGTDVDCSDDGPHGFFLLTWPASVVVATCAMACLWDAQVPRRTRVTGVVIAALVMVAAGAWYLVVVIDGIQECGF